MNEELPSGMSREFCEEHGLDYETAKQETDAIAERVVEECKGKPRKEFEKALTEAISAWLKEKLGDKAPEVKAIDLSEGAGGAIESLLEAMKEAGINVDPEDMDDVEIDKRCMRVFGDVVRALLKIPKVQMGNVLCGLIQTTTNCVASGTGLKLREEYQKDSHPVRKVIKKLDVDMKHLALEAGRELKEIAKNEEFRRN